MRQFFKKALAVVLTGVLLAGASISAAAAPQELSVTPPSPQAKPLWRETLSL